MQNDNRIFADFVKFVNSAAGTFAGMGREAGDSTRERVREFFGGMDFVSREEFDAVKKMAAAAREEADALKARVAALEAAAAPAKAAPAAKPAAKAAKPSMAKASEKTSTAKPGTAKPGNAKKS